jgi:hypothetical protein
MVGSMPEIAGGYGSVSRFGLRFGRGVLSAVCRNRRLATGFGAAFADGTELTRRHDRALYCSEAPPRLMLSNFCAWYDSVFI